MQSNTSNLSRAARAVLPTNQPTTEPPPQLAVETTCPDCGYRGRPTLTGSYPSCLRCGTSITADAAGADTTSNRWTAYWGDALVVLALSVLVYLLTAMTWNAYFRP